MSLSDEFSDDAVDTGVGMCSPHNLHCTDYTWNNIERIIRRIIKRTIRGFFSFNLNSDHSFIEKKENIPPVALFLPGIWLKKHGLDFRF